MLPRERKTDDPDRLRVLCTLPQVLGRSGIATADVL